MNLIEKEDELYRECIDVLKKLHEKEQNKEEKEEEKEKQNKEENFQNTLQIKHHHQPSIDYPFPPSTLSSFKASNH